MSNETILIVAGTLLLFATIFVPWCIKRLPLWAKAAWRLTAFVLLTLLVEKTLGSPFAPQFISEPPGQRVWEQVIAIWWWVVAAQCAIGLTRVFLVFETKPRETRIVSDLIAAIIQIIALFGIIDFVFAVPIGGLLATSGVIAIVLGLALQSSLSDVFSGIAVGIERPYSAGDLVWVEGGIEGRVIQINWRSTHIATINHDVAIVPNSVMAKSRLVNHSLPTTTRGTSVSVKLSANELPDRCVAALTAAVKTCVLLAESPAPNVSRTDVAGDGVTYEISFSIPSIEALIAARTELLGQVQVHLRHAGISLAVPGGSNMPHGGILTPETLLQESDWFGILAAEDRKVLADNLVEVWYAPEDKLMAEGEDSKAMFIIASGAVEISDGPAGSRKPVHRLGPGGSLGAIAMITESTYAATARALTPVTAYRLDNKGVGDAMALRPELTSGLEVLARRGRELQRTDVVAHPGDRFDEPDQFLSKLRVFLRRISESPVRSD